MGVGFLLVVSQAAQSMKGKIWFDTGHSRDTKGGLTVSASEKKREARHALI